MTEFKGTKGKWELHETPNENSSGIYFQSISSDNDNNILVANAYGITTEHAMINAKLIACAPEMLEMLEKIEQDYDCGTDTYKKLVLLIKKATE